MIKSAILEEQKAQLKKEELAARILNQSRNELYLKLRYLDLALGNLALAPGTVSPAGTDGRRRSKQSEASAVKLNTKK